jgi:IclR family pca regulon transcriptional regulator
MEKSMKEMIDTDIKDNGSSATGGGQQILVTSLVRGLGLLTLFTPQTPKLTFSELYKKSNLPRTTVHRLLGTLTTLEYLCYDEETRQYFPGPRVMSLGFSALIGMKIRHKARPHMAKLSRQVNETVNLAGRDGLDIVYYERIEVKQIINIDLPLGARLPLHNTALGRCLIAFLPPREREALMTSLDSVLTATNSHSQLSGHIEFGHRHGYTISDEDFARGLRAIAMPVWNYELKVVAALNVSVPTSRVSVEDLRNNFSSPLFQTTKKISLSLGAPENWIEGEWRKAIIHGE